MKKGKQISDLRSGATQDTDPTPIAKLQGSAEVLHKVGVPRRTPGYCPDCGKHRYPDKKSAVSAKNLRLKGRKHYRHNRPKDLRAYACPDCAGWCLTKKV